VGSYVYPAQGPSAIRPHAIQSIPGIGTGNFGYDTNGNLTSIPGVMTAAWTSYDMPKTITKNGSTSTFTYGPEHQRTNQIRSDGRTVIYAGAQEIENNSGQVTVKTYWPYGVGVEIDRPVAGAAPTNELNWMHVDRLGSPIAISDNIGNLRERLAYDAWGKRRTLNGAPINGTPTPNSIDGVTDNRGFTGHEMLDLLDLVHMNGRIYDPLLGKFLSADPLIQDPMNGQSYNRYSYVLNNPTNLTDPTGFASKQCVTSTGTNIPTCAGDDDVVMNFADGSKQLLRGNGKGETVEKVAARMNNSSGTENTNSKNQNPAGGNDGSSTKAEGARLSDQIPGPDGKPTPPQASYNPTALERAKDAVGDFLGEFIYRAQGIPGEAFVVGTVAGTFKKAAQAEKALSQEAKILGEALAKDPGLATFVQKLRAGGVEVISVNQNILGTNGNVLGEIDVVTKNALIQYKSNVSSARDVLTQVQEKTLPFVNRTVVTFIDSTTRAGQRTVDNAARHGILITNKIEQLIGAIK
jgi:RHS repeat-associated protein